MAPGQKRMRELVIVLLWRLVWLLRRVGNGAISTHHCTRVEFQVHLLSYDADETLPLHDADVVTNVHEVMHSLLIGLVSGRVQRYNK